MVQGPATAGIFAVVFTSTTAATIQRRTVAATNLTTATLASGYAAPYSSNNSFPTNQNLLSLTLPKRVNIKQESKTFDHVNSKVVCQVNLTYPFPLTTNQLYFYELSHPLKSLLYLEKEYI